MDTIETTNILLKRVPKELILVLSETDQPISISYLSKKINATYCHTHKCLIQFKKFHWITITKKGRSQLCKITEEGKKVVKAVMVIVISGEEIL